MAAVEAIAQKIELPVAAASVPARVGRYRICGEIASGGMASVYLAVADREDEDGGTGVTLRAIKRVHPHLAQQREFVEMFVDEARIATRIRHPNVGGVIEWGEADGTFFLAMELLRGESGVALLRRLRKHTAVLEDPRWACCAVRIIADACAGLHAAHELVDEHGEPMHVVHRDVSPHNLFVTWDGEAKIVDFGIAQAKHRLHQTTTGTVKGKFAYMAPEQLQGTAVDRRADVWSLGVVLWELLSARPLFRRKVETETIFAVLEGAIPAFSSVGVETVPLELEAIVRRALTPDPSRRTPSAQALGSELEAWLRTAGGCRTWEVADALTVLFPGERETEDEKVQRALAGSTSIRPRRESETPALSGVQLIRHGPSRVGDAAAWAVALAAGALLWFIDAGFARAPVAIDPIGDVAASASEGGIAAGGGAGPRLARLGLGGAAIDDPSGVEGAAAVDGTAVDGAFVDGAAIDGEVVDGAAVDGARLGVRGAGAGDAAGNVGRRAGAVVPTAAASIATRARPRDRAGASRSAARAAGADAAASAEPEDDAGTGALDVATSGGWAEVWLGSRRLGHTPGRFELPAGRHTLVLRRAGGVERAVSVRIGAGQLARLRVDLDAR
jgi:serine/threonine protein kinase